MNATCIFPTKFRVFFLLVLPTIALAACGSDSSDYGNVQLNANAIALLANSPPDNGPPQWDTPSSQPVAVAPSSPSKPPATENETASRSVQCPGTLFADTPDEAEAYLDCIYKHLEKNHMSDDEAVRWEELGTEIGEYRTHDPVSGQRNGLQWDWSESSSAEQDYRDYMMTASNHEIDDTGRLTSEAGGDTAGETTAVVQESGGPSNRPTQVGTKCVVVLPGNPNWYVQNHCSFRAIGKFCYEDHSILSCSRGGGGFGPISPGVSEPVSPPQNHYVQWRTNTCRYDAWLAGSCIPRL